MIADSKNITFYHHIKLLDKKNYARDGVHISASDMASFVTDMRGTPVAAGTRLGYSPCVRHV